MGINVSEVMGPEILGRVRRAMEGRRCRERNDESIFCSDGRKLPFYLYTDSVGD